MKCTTFNIVLNTTIKEIVAIGNNVEQCKRAEYTMPETMTASSRSQGSHEARAAATSTCYG